MFKSVEGVYRGGKIELLEPAPSAGDSRVLVTFLPSATTVLLKDRGIDQAQAADLRTRLAAFTAEWSAPEMDIYDET
jgi:hypothetical protein